MAMTYEERIREELMRKGIPKGDAFKTEAVARFLYENSHGRAGRRISQIIGEAWLFDGFSRDGQIDKETARRVIDHVGIAMEVMLHVGWVYSDNSVRYSISAKGLEALQALDPSRAKV